MLQNQEAICKKKGKAYQVQEGSDSSTSGDEHAFKVADRNNTGSTTDLTVGGVKLHSVLIDSGASCSIVDAETWENLKQRKIQASLKPSTRKLFAYSQDQPIAVLGIFTADISCDETKKTCNEEIIVIKGQGQALI